MAVKKAPSKVDPPLPPPPKNTEEGKRTTALADWVMARSAELVKNGMKQAAADKQAMSEMKKQFPGKTKVTKYVPGSLPLPSKPESKGKDTKGNKPAPTGNASNTVNNKKDKSKNPPAPKSGWEDVVRTKFSAFSYLLDKPEVFGAEITDIMRRAIKEEWYKNPDGGRQQMEAAIKATPYWQNTSAQAVNFDSLKPTDQQAVVNNKAVELKAIIGGDALPPVVFNALARDAARLGMTGEQLSQFAYQTVFKAKVAGGYEFIPATERALVSADAEQVKQIAKSYFTTAADADIQGVLTGQITADDLRVRYAAKAKGQFAHLADQIDNNLTLEEITADYKKYAANVLEKDESQIDMMNPMFLEAIASDDGKGSKKQLSIGEWVQKLRTDERYGYQYTKQANNEANNLAVNILRAFGGLK